MNIVLKQLVNDIHHKYGIPKKVIEKVINNQFLFVREAMAEGEKNDIKSFRNINLTHLGKFAVREHLLKKYKEHYDNRTEDSQ